MTEKWKIYKVTYSKRYGEIIFEVSNYGNVKCNKKLYKCCINKSGYKILCRKYLHRIVAELFIPNPENKPCIDHIDSNKLNNRIYNLRWVTRKENNNNPNEHEIRSSSHKGQIPWNKGKKGLQIAWNKGKTHSEETKRKISEVLKGRVSPCGMLGKHHSKETKEKISKSLKNKE